MQAIITEYLEPSNTKGARIKAFCHAGSVTIDYPHELIKVDCHAKAAMALVRELGWENYGAWVCGQISSGEYVFTCGRSYAPDFQA